jgi:hypothetical protein
LSHNSSAAVIFKSSNKLANASSVGANTVNGHSAERASTNPAACTAAISVGKLQFATAVATTFSCPLSVGSHKALRTVGGRSTSSTR